MMSNIFSICGEEDETTCNIFFKCRVVCLVRGGMF